MSLATFGKHIDGIAKENDSLNMTEGSSKENQSSNTLK